MSNFEILRLVNTISLPLDYMKKPPAWPRHHSPSRKKWRDNISVETEISNTTWRVSLKLLITHFQLHYDIRPSFSMHNAREIFPRTRYRFVCHFWTWDRARRGFSVGKGITGKLDTQTLHRTVRILGNIIQPTVADSNRLSDPQT